MFAEHVPLDLMKKIISLILLILLLVGCASTGISQKEGVNTVDREENKAIVLRFVKEVQNQHDVSVMDELFSPEDTVILTAGCAKYRYNKLDLGDIGGIPRVLDAGQCNDSYSLAVIALKLKDVFGLDDVNKLPIAYNIA